jgi:hypothetical protein
MVMASQGMEMAWLGNGMARQLHDMEMAWNGKAWQWHGLEIE